MIKYPGKYSMYSDINAVNHNRNDYYQYNNISNTNQASMYLSSGIQLPNQYDQEENNDSDIQYMKSMYPDFCKKIQAYIEEECDKLEYDGSYMYDEYPDRETIEQITDKINDTFSKDESLKAKEEVEADVTGMQLRGGYDFQRDLVEILLLNELFSRRRHGFYGGRYRKNRNYYSPYYYNYRQYFY
ncbi:MAG: hypothetical protein CVU84_06425 [Firmicutes bacterium HGW-Firmicutes-1]|jgi:hypothetical protein|nr:MAG: hypothetical protein CVU84_06425 [Firmicutes bacterium HGW-Firmicutes-1]